MILCHFIIIIITHSGEENIWILKPWNLGRSMDIFITSDLTQIIRLSQSLPRVSSSSLSHSFIHVSLSLWFPWALLSLPQVVSRYITNPVLFYREGIGKVKMDVRYIVLLVSVKPLVLYTYNVFWLRFANKLVKETLPLLTLPLSLPHCVL